MIIIGISDVHGDMVAIGRMNDIIRHADVVLFVGDITNFGREPETAKVVEPVLQLAKKTFAVSGNCDNPEVDDYLTRQGLNLHGRGEMLDGVGFVGLGGSLITPFRTPNEYTESEIEAFLDHGFADLPENTDAPLALVSHQPPIQTKCDRIITGDHVGSEAVRRFIENRRPVVCFTGHIHESRAVDTIGVTYIINPGMLPNGRYAFAEIRNGTASVEIRSF